jgi:hypothetical protein
MAKAPFVVTPELTAVAVAYKNGKMIADEVLPRVMVGKELFKYRRYPAAESFTLPQTLVGRTGQPNQVQFSSTEVTDSTQDHALDVPVPNKDLKNAQAENAQNAAAVGTKQTVDPRNRAAMMVTDLIKLRREKRAADLVFNPASYAGANQQTLSGTGQWSDYANSNPQSAIMNALDGMIMRGNVGVFGRRAWTIFAQHPRICKAVYGNNTDAGFVTQQQVAQLLELDGIVVGEGWVNTAAPGQAATLVRVWGNHASFLHRNMLADTEFGITFGYTAQFGDLIAGEIEDPDIGAHGGVRVRVSESVKELVTANDLGYYFQNAVA